MSIKEAIGTGIVPNTVMFKLNSIPTQINRVNWFSLVRRNKILAYDVEGSKDTTTVCFTILAGYEFSTLYLTND